MVKKEKTDTFKGMKPDPIPQYHFDYFPEPKITRKSYIIPVNGMNVLLKSYPSSVQVSVQDQPDPAHVLHTFESLGFSHQTIFEHQQRFIPVGRIDSVPVFSCISDPEDFTEPFVPLRGLYMELKDSLFWFIGRGSQLARWHSWTRFCGSCGHPNELSQGEISKKCPECGTQVYPRLSPAIIVAVTREHQGERQVLLARHRGRGFFGLIAGFVEPGETVEQAVAREVKEETNLEITDIQYIRSQPWPFPESLMLGFRAQVVPGELIIQESELEEARWCASHSLPTLPSTISLSRYLTELVLKP